LKLRLPCTVWYRVYQFRHFSINFYQRACPVPYGTGLPVSPHQHTVFVLFIANLTIF